MSGIQRWHLYSPIMREESETGEWVAYADHVAALAAERNKDLAQWLGEAGEREYERGVSAERARIRTAIIELVDEVGWRTIALEAIDNEED